MRPLPPSANYGPLWRFFLGVAYCSLCVTGCGWFSRPAPPPKEPESWTYQLQNINLDKLAESPHRLVVMDPSRGGEGDSAGLWSTEDLDRLHRAGKTVLAYLSIGEAEEYRDYWKKEWANQPPPFLDRPNQDGFEDNHLVKYWNPDWQDIVTRRVEHLAKLGFDGVYLDKVDAFEEWEAHGNAELDPSQLKGEMASFVRRLAQKGREQRAGFKVYLQNGRQLWSHRLLTEQTVDGVALEEFSLGWEGEDGTPTPESVREEMRVALKLAEEQNWTRLVVDYPSSKTDPAALRAARREAERVGALPVVVGRDLDGTFK